MSSLILTNLQWRWRVLAKNVHQASELRLETLVLEQGCKIASSACCWWPVSITIRLGWKYWVWSVHQMWADMRPSPLDAPDLLFIEWIKLFGRQNDSKVIVPCQGCPGTAPPRHTRRRWPSTCCPSCWATPTPRPSPAARGGTRTRQPASSFPWWVCLVPAWLCSAGPFLVTKATNIISVLQRSFGAKREPVQTAE